MTSYAYQAILEASSRANWRVEDLLRSGTPLDFDRRFLPEALAPAGTLDFLTAAEQRRLNQLRAHQYVSILGRLEEILVPFGLDQVGPELDLDDLVTRARLGAVGEETKHVVLFLELREAIRAGLDLDGGAPEGAFAGVTRAAGPLAAALFALHLDWMTQQHFSASLAESGDLDPVFAGLFRLHWTEETQHAALDGDQVVRLAAGRSAGSIAEAVEEYLGMIEDLDRILGREAAAGAMLFPKLAGRILDGAEQHRLEASLLEGLRWTFLGSGMTHPRFLRMVETISPAGRQRIERAAREYRR